MKIINYGHACFKVIDDGVSIVFDPYRFDSVPGMELPKGIKANYVFCSHDHYDHDAFNKVKLEKINQDLNLKEFVIPHDKEGGKKRGMNTARVVRFSDYSLCHLGDIGDPNSIKNIDEMKNIDVVLCPINGFFTIGALEAIELQKVMGWKLLIPMHYHIARDNSGYPDGEQIEIFKKNCQTFELDDYELEINDEIIKHGALAFLKRKED